VGVGLPAVNLKLSHCGNKVTHTHAYVTHTPKCVKQRVHIHMQNKTHTYTQMCTQTSTHVGTSRLAGAKKLTTKVLPTYY
jgi:hypothetical protein